MTIGSVQGSGAVAPGVGQVVRIEGTVVGDFQQGGFDGYYVQDAGDGDTATSDGIFVFAPSGADVASGDAVSVAGTVAEFFGLTQLTGVTVDPCSSGAALPTAAPLTLPATEAQREAVEGMLVTVPQSLTDPRVLRVRPLRHSRPRPGPSVPADRHVPAGNGGSGR